MLLLFHHSGLILTTFITLLFAATIPVYRVNSEPTQDKQALIAFISLTPHANRIQWNRSNSVCSWTGVQCDSTRSYVSTLRLPGAGLFGEIPANTLGRLKQLRVLSLRSNRLSGKIPADFSNLVMLRSLYLQNNLFSDEEFPASFTGLARLARLDLSSNNFSGSIPFAVNNLTRLNGLFLENNRFSGNLPSINPPNLADFNVSNNNLNGSIPESLQKFPISAFAGNLNLCGGPLPECDSFFPSPTPSPLPSSDILPIPLGAKSKKLSKGAIIAIAVCSALFLLILLLLLLFCLRRRKQKKTLAPKPTPASRQIVVADAGTSSSKDDVTGGSMETEKKKLVFIGNGKYSFDLEDLLRASAEVLGKGSIGTSYKAVLEEGTTVVVKRLKDVVVTKSEFDAQMEVLGNIRHDNVVPFQAYYFSKDEKLLISDYMASGSLSSLLHGSRGSGRTPLDWENRKKIALSTAKGIAYLHTSGNLVHGNVKSSNVLLRPDHDVALSDFGLNPLFGSATPPNRVAGYRAPEILETRRVTFQSDVYSFGVLLLELLTGKAPNQASLGEEGIDLPRWVQSVVREEWTAEVFDAELMRYNNIEEEMVSLLQIAMSCVSYMPDQRPKIQEVVRLIEDLYNDGLRHSSDDPSKGSGGQTPPMESRTPPRSITP